MESSGSRICAVKGSHTMKVKRMSARQRVSYIALNSYVAELVRVAEVIDTRSSEPVDGVTSRPVPASPSVAKSPLPLLRKDES